MDAINPHYAASLAKIHAMAGDNSIAISYCKQFMEVSAKEKLTAEEKNICISSAEEVINALGGLSVSGDGELGDIGSVFRMNPMLPPLGFLLNGGYASSFAEFNELSNSHATYGSYSKHCIDTEIDIIQEMSNFCALNGID